MPLKFKWPSEENKRFRVLCLSTLCAGLILFVTARWQSNHSRLQDPTPKFEFPTKQLAALDRDLQARFAVVPDKDFGIERTYGYQHYLYNPQTPAELRTIADLKKERTDAAFYLMSRSLWLRSWDGAGYKPIQGPVYITRKIDLPLPRKVNFEPAVGKWKQDAEILDEEGANFIEGGSGSSHNPQGTPVAEPTPPKNSPKANQLQLIGNRVFEMAEYAPIDAKIGVAQPINDHWKVVAVPIRASQKACLPCHSYQLMGRKPRGRTTLDVGDTLGVAFYLYSTKQKAQAKLVSK